MVFDGCFLFVWLGVPRFSFEVSSSHVLYINLQCSFDLWAFALHLRLTQRLLVNWSFSFPVWLRAVVYTWIVVIYKSPGNFLQLQMNRFFYAASFSSGPCVFLSNHSFSWQSSAFVKASELCGLILSETIDTTCNKGVITLPYLSYWIYLSLLNGPKANDVYCAPLSNSASSWFFRREVKLQCPWKSTGLRKSEAIHWVNALPACRSCLDWAPVKLIPVTWPFWVCRNLKVTITVTKPIRNYHGWWFIFAKRKASTRVDPWPCILSTSGKNQAIRDNVI